MEVKRGKDGWLWTDVGIGNHLDEKTGLIDMACCCPYIPEDFMKKQNEDIKICVMRKTHIKECAAIAKELWPNEARVHRHITHELHNPDIYFIVAKKDKEIVGWAGWSWSSISYDIAEFVWCNVKTEYQKQGIGRLLTEARLKAIKSFGIAKLIMLTTGKPIVYKKYGFNTVGVYPLFIGPETHLMVKEL